MTIGDGAHAGPGDAVSTGQRMAQGQKERRLTAPGSTASSSTISLAENYPTLAQCPAKQKSPTSFEIGLFRLKMAWR